MASPPMVSITFSARDEHAAPPVVPDVPVDERVPRDLECPLCWKAFHLPVTTACGHSFCRPCIMRAIEDQVAPMCPLCRKTVFVNHASPVTYVIQSTLATLFPRAAAARAAEAAIDDAWARTVVPVFVMADVIVLPGEKLVLNVYETRYLRMMSAVMTGGSAGRFVLAHRHNYDGEADDAVVGGGRVSRTVREAGLFPVATMLVVEDSRAFRGGSMLVHTVGEEVVRMAEVSVANRGGYLVTVAEPAGISAKTSDHDDGAAGGGGDPDGDDEGGAGGVDNPENHDHTGQADGGDELERLRRQVHDLMVDIAEEGVAQGCDALRSRIELSGTVPPAGAPLAEVYAWLMPWYETIDLDTKEALLAAPSEAAALGVLCDELAAFAWVNPHSYCAIL